MTPPDAPAAHLAVLKRPYLDAVIEGRKTVELRLSRTRAAPFGKVAARDTIYLKQSSGPVRARATAARVLSLEDLTPAGVRALEREHNHLVLGAPDYWRAKSSARYATLIWLADVRELTPDAPRPRAQPFYGNAWRVLDHHPTPTHPEPAQPA